MYYTYMLRCIDNSIYTGITTDIERRAKEHFSQNEKCAKYTKRHKVYKIECAWESSSRILASKLEYHIKKSLNKNKKEQLIKNNMLLNEYLGDQINSVEYKRINVEIYNNKNEI